MTKDTDGWAWDQQGHLGMCVKLAKFVLVYFGAYQCIKASKGLLKTLIPWVTKCSSKSSKHCIHPYSGPKCIKVQRPRPRRPHLVKVLKSFEISVNHPL